MAAPATKRPRSSKHSPTPASTRGGWTKQPEAIRSRAILDAARRCFAQKGFNGSSVQDIADAARLTKGGVYFHFDSKEAIRDALIAEFTDVSRFGLKAPELLRLAPRPRLRAQIERVIAGLRGAHEGAIMTLAEAVTRQGAGKAEVRTFFLAVVEQLALTIGEGQRHGDFRPDADTALLAEMVLAAVDGLALHHELDRAGINMCRGVDRVLDLIVASISVPSQVKS